MLPGARPTNAILIEFEIWSKLGALLFKICLTDHTDILHTPRQLHYRDVCNTFLWSIEYILNQSTAKFGRISNSIEISLAGRVPGLVRVLSRFRRYFLERDSDNNETGHTLQSQSIARSHDALWGIYNEYRGEIRWKYTACYITLITLLPLHVTVYSVVDITAYIYTGITTIHRNNI